MFFLKPAQSILNKMTFMKKLVAIFFLIFIPVSMVTYLYIDSMRENVNISRAERAGLAYVKEIHSLIKQSQQHRGLSVGFLNGDEEVLPLLERAKTGIEETFQTLETQIQNDGDQFSVQEDVRILKEQWQTIESQYRSYTPEKSIDMHTDFIVKQLDLSTTIAGASNLFLDYELRNYHMVTLIVEKLPLITELMGESRAAGTGIAARGTKLADDEFRMLYLKHSLEKQVHEVERSLEVIFREDEQLRQIMSTQAEESIGNVNRLINILETEFLNKENITINTVNYFEFTTEAIDGYFEFIAVQTDLLDSLLEERIARDILNQTIIFSIIGITFLLLIYVFLAFYSSMKESITSIQRSAAQIADGDLTETVTITSNDEMKEIGDSLNYMVASVKSVIESNQLVAQELSASSEELTAVTEETSKATEQITYSMEDVAKVIERQMNSTKVAENAVNEMTTSLGTVVERTNQVSETAKITTMEAENGQVLVENTIGQMESISKAINQTSTVIEELNDKSTSIGKIIDVITSIADQTNLLALNAAIEAARAGENGRGFSVVADEVRKLAEESAASAKNIYSLVQEVQKETTEAKSSMELVLQEANAGIETVHLTGEGFFKIISATKDVEVQIKEVASLATNVASFIDNLVETITETAEMAKKSEENAQTVAASSEEQLASMEEIASTVTTLNDRAQDLLQSIEKFRV